VISLHLEDGQTISFDLLNDGAREWLEKLARPEFQAKLTAVTINMKHPSKGGEGGVQYSVAKPKGFDDAQWFHVERVEPSGKIRGGEKIDLFIGGLKITLMCHASQPAARISIAKIGRRKFNPSKIGERVQTCLKSPTK
jgi:hypothetical protein